MTDVFAAGAMFECSMDAGWEVPGQFAVSGFGDYEIARDFPVGLTTIRTHGYDIGAAAARLLRDRLDAGASPDRRVSIYGVRTGRARQHVTRAHPESSALHQADPAPRQSAAKG